MDNAKRFVVAAAVCASAVLAVGQSSKVDFEQGRLRFTIPPQWESRKDDVRFEGQLEGETLCGTTTDDNPLLPQPVQISSPATAKNIVAVGASMSDCFTAFGSADCEGTNASFTRMSLLPDPLRPGAYQVSTTSQSVRGSRHHRFSGGPSGRRQDAPRPERRKPGVWMP